MAPPMLAGTLEKRAKWCKEWRPRFCVMRDSRIDYYIQPPAILDDEHAEPARGFISLHDPLPMEEPGRPYCIRVGDVLLSCTTYAEQQRWLRSIHKVAGTEMPPAPQSRATASMAEEPPLLLLPPRGPPQSLQWHEKTILLLPAGEVDASVLLLDGGSISGGGSGSTTESACARALCRLQLSQSSAAETTFAVEPLPSPHGRGCGALGERTCLRVIVHSNGLDRPTLRSLCSPANACLTLATALFLGGSQILGTLLVVLTVFLLAFQPRLVSVHSPQRRVVFSAERLETLSASPEAPLVPLDPPPLWVGRWKLDKSCSEKYEPILADMGVNFVLRKAADTVKSALIISVSGSHVTIFVKTLVSIEDKLPLDGSWTTKPVPPGGRMKGELRVRLSKVSASELEMYTEFPAGEGDLRDTLTVHEDGRSFTRKVVRGELSVTRVFRRE